MNGAPPAVRNKALYCSNQKCANLQIFQHLPLTMSQKGLKQRTTAICQRLKQLLNPALLINDYLIP